MKTEITALREQLAQGQLDDARLAAAAETFERADDDIDATLGTLPTPTGGGGETGGGGVNP